MDYIACVCVCVWRKCTNILWKWLYLSHFRSQLGGSIKIDFHSMYSINSLVHERSFFSWFSCTPFSLEIVSLSLSLSLPFCMCTLSATAISYKFILHWNVRPSTIGMVWYDVCGVSRLNFNNIKRQLAWRRMATIIGDDSCRYMRYNFHTNKRNTYIHTKMFTWNKWVKIASE